MLVAEAVKNELSFELLGPVYSSWRVRKEGMKWLEISYTPEV